MEESDGPPSAGVAHINEHGQEQFGGILKCSWTPQKGRIVRAARQYEIGEVILSEPPLHIVQEKACPAFKKLKELCRVHADDFDYEPLWYWCALQSLTKAQVEGALAQGCIGVAPGTQRNLLLLHHDEASEPSAAARRLAKELVPGADPATIERLIQVWVLNCFEYSDDPQGYSTYFFSSFMSHSCYPNAVWYYEGANHVLRCRREINVGDEVCISYLPESGLLQSVPAMRMELHETKQFWCDCERCAPNEVDFSRGLKCPMCKHAVFPNTPVAGPAKDGSLLAEHWVGVGCKNCGAEMTAERAQKLAETESQLQAILDTYNRGKATNSVKKLQEDEAFIEAHTHQHVLADLIREQLITHYATKKMADKRLQLMRQRVEFSSKAYPGLSGAHAWAMEALGDALRAGPKRPTTEEMQKLNGAWEQTWAAQAAEYTEEARALYNAAIEVLTPMFGEDHEHVADVNAKLIELDC